MPAQLTGTNVVKAGIYACSGFNSTTGTVLLTIEGKGYDSNHGVNWDGWFSINLVIVRAEVGQTISAGCTAYICPL